MEQIFSCLCEALNGFTVKFIPHSIGSKVTDDIRNMKNGDICLLENLRFHPGEEENDPEFSKSLALLGDCFVNDAFSVSHRAHASTVGIARLMPSFAGPLMDLELKALSNSLDSPKRPLTAIIGGAKISTKLDLLRNIVKLVDKMIVGGGMANTFLFARGVSIGNSLVEKDLTNLVQTIERLATENSCEIILQNDALIATKLESGANYKAVELDDIPDNAMILDAGPNSIPVFSNHIKDSNTIIWNGPLGAFECPPFDTSTTAIAKLVGKLSQKGNLYSIAGGGDTLAALNQAGVVKKLNYVSTAGGAFLEWLEGKELPGIAALKP
jgi:phosphoglycerate kinase